MTVPISIEEFDRATRRLSGGFSELTKIFYFDALNLPVGISSSSVTSELARRVQKIVNVNRIVGNQSNKNDIYFTGSLRKSNGTTTTEASVYIALLFTKEK